MKKSDPGLNIQLNRTFVESRRVSVLYF